MGKGATQTQTVSPDSNTSQYQDLWRKAIAGAFGSLTGNAALQNYAGSSFSGANLGLPSLQSLEDATKADYAYQGSQAANAVDATATADGAFGGSRAAIAKAAALAANQRGLASTLAGLRTSYSQDQFSRIAALLGLMGDASKVGGYTQSQYMPGNGLAGILGGALSIGALPTGEGGTLAGDVLHL